MAVKKTPAQTLRRAVLSPRALRWGLLVLSLAVLAWLAAWLAQRSLSTPARKRALQTWLDDTLNADVSILGEMVVRLNLVRDSRLFLHRVEVEHPNPTFPGKFARIGRLAAWAPPWAAAGMVAGGLDIAANDVHLEIEQAASGEWSHDGLLQPLAAGDNAFPFPMPKFDGWTLELNRARLELRRRGYELGLSADARLDGRAGGRRLTLRADSVPFTFGAAGEGARKSGTAGPLNLGLRLGEERGSLPSLVPGACQAVVRELPLATLPFLATGIPMEDAPGVFNGLIRYDRNEGAAPSLVIEGELADAPLSVFGLPRAAPLRLRWPVLPVSEPGDGKKHQADIHIGPSGFGAFTMTIPFAADGRPEALAMRGDVAALDALPGFFLNSPQWPDWLSRTFPLIEWRSGKWLGFGWEGGELSLSLTRGAAGMTLAGEAELMGGRARLSVPPMAGSGGSGAAPPPPITVEAERLDAARLSERLSRMLPERFRARLRGGSAGFTWRGIPDGLGGVKEWDGGMVWAGAAVDVGASGTWWRGLARIPDAILMALPQWGGGDGEALRELAGAREIAFEQISVVFGAAAEGGLAVEFRAFGAALGQVAGRIEQRDGGVIEGELLFSGEPAFLRAAEKANPDLGNALRMLAGGSPGLRAAFRYDRDRGGEFIFPFLHDAAALREALRGRTGGGE